TDRFLGTVPPPPLTPADQALLVQKIQDGRLKRVALADVQMLAPLAGLKGLPFKLERLSDARRKQERQAVKDLPAAAAKRQQALDRLARKPGPAKPTDKLQVTTISLPGADTAVRPTKAVKPPALPTLPKAVVKTIPWQRPVTAVKLARKVQD